MVNAPPHHCHTQTRQRTTTSVGTFGRRRRVLEAQHKLGHLVAGLYVQLAARASQATSQSTPTSIELSCAPFDGLDVREVALLGQREHIERLLPPIDWVLASIKATTVHETDLDILPLLEVLWNIH